MTAIDERRGGADLSPKLCPLSAVPDGRQCLDTVLCTTIKPSRIHGWGLFADRDFPKETDVGHIDGQLIRWDDLEIILATTPGVTETNLEWNALSEDILLVRFIRTKYGYINHSRSPNLKLQRGPFRITTKRSIFTGEEMTLDYREEPLRREYLEGHGSTYL